MNKNKIWRKKTIENVDQENKVVDYLFLST